MSNSLPWLNFPKSTIAYWEAGWKQLLMESEEGREADQKQKAVSNFDSKDYNEQDKVQIGPLCN